MTESEWLSGSNPEAMLKAFNFTKDSIQGRLDPPSDRKLRLIATAVTRWAITDPSPEQLDVLSVGERLADGLADDKELYAAFKIESDTNTPPRNARETVLLHMAIHNHTWSGKSAAIQVTSYVGMVRNDPKVVADIIREIAGNPYRPVTLPKVTRWKTCDKCDGTGYVKDTGSTMAPRMIACMCNPANGAPGFHYGRVHDGEYCPWVTPTVLGLATSAEYHRDPASGIIDPKRLMVLADALEEAGCPLELVYQGPREVYLLCTECESRCERKYTYEWGNRREAYTCPKHGWRSEVGTKRTRTVREPNPLLTHLRSPGPHYYGCWALDTILGRK